jgi:hypothetical protein
MKHVGHPFNVFQSQNLYSLDGIVYTKFMESNFTMGDAVYVVQINPGRSLSVNIGTSWCEYAIQNITGQNVARIIHQSSNLSFVCTKLTNDTILAGGRTESPGNTLLFELRLCLLNHNLA